MSGQRYADLQQLTGQRTAEVQTILEACFANKAALESFAQEHFRSVWSQINWDTSFKFACHELLKTDCNIGDLLQVLGECNPTNIQIPELISYLVAAGYLQDLQQPPRQSTNPHNMDWVQRHLQDVAPLTGSLREAALNELEACFESAAAVEGFILDNFPNQHGRQVAHRLNRRKPVRAIVESVLVEFEQLSWRTAFIHAAQELPGGAESATLCFLVAASGVRHESSGAPPKPAGSTVPTRVICVFGYVDSALLAPSSCSASPKALNVRSVVGDFSAPQEIALRDLLVKSFDGGALKTIAQFYLEQRLEHIVASGNLNDVCLGLVRWCSQQIRLPQLINAMQKERPLNQEIPAFVRRLADAGVFQLEE